MGSKAIDSVFGDDQVEGEAPEQAVAEIAAEEDAPEDQPETVERPADAATEVEQPIVEQERMVPLAALQEERRARQAMQDELDRFRRQQGEVQAKPQAIPDPVDDPNGYNAHISHQIAMVEANTRFNMSEVMAREKHGDEVVQAAIAWGMEKAKSNPGFQQEVLAQPNPIDWIVRQQKRDAMLGEIGDDPKAYARKIAEAEGWLPAPNATSVVTQQQASPPARVPRSLANEGGSSSDVRHVPTGPLAGVDAVFG